MRRLERGASYVPLIIVIVLLLVAVIWAYVKQDEADQLKKDVADFQKKWKTEQSLRVELSDHLKNKVAPKIGYTYKGDQPEFEKFIVDPDLATAELKKAFDKVNRTWAVEVPIAAFKNPETNEDYQFPDQEGPGFKFDPGTGGFRRVMEDKYRIKYVEDIPGTSGQDIKTYTKITDAAAMRMVHDIQQLVKQLKMNHESAEAARKQAVEREKILKENVAAKQRALDEEQRTSQATIQGLRTEVSKLRDDVQKAGAALDREKKERAVEVAGLNDDIEAKQQQVVKLKVKKIAIEKPIGPDGSVIAAAAGRGIVILDRGRADHMIPGLIFDVYGFGKGAVKLPKGTVKVLEVMEHTCKCRVLDLFNDLKPIVQGDKFESITYNPKEVMHFRLIGRFRKYGKSDAERRLEQIGVAVDKAVTIDTDFLVMGAPEGEEENLRDTADYKLAMELGIKVLTEEQLSRFLLY